MTKLIGVFFLPHDMGLALKSSETVDVNISKNKFDKAVILWRGYFVVERKKKSIDFQEIFFFTLSPLKI